MSANRNSFGRGGFNKPNLQQIDTPPPAARPRDITATQFYWLNMTVPFTSTASEQKIGATLVEQFPLLVRGAWSNLVQPRVRFVGQASGIPISTLQVPLLTLAGNTNLALPMNY